jgi:glutaredoxin
MSNRQTTRSTPITLYALQTCSHCKDTKKLLQERDIPFRTVFVDMLVGGERSDVMRYLRSVNPSVSFPTLVVGEKTVVGFKKKEIEAALRAFANRKGD